MRALLHRFRLRPVALSFVAATLLGIALIPNSSQVVRLTANQASELHGGQIEWYSYYWDEYCIPLYDCQDDHCDGQSNCVSHSETTKLPDTGDSICVPNDSQGNAVACRESIGSNTCAVILGACEEQEFEETINGEPVIVYVCYPVWINYNAWAWAPTICETP